MQFAGINYLAVIAATVASWLFGALWYGLLSRQWLAAQGKTLEECKETGNRSLAPFVISFIAELAMAFMLGGLLAHLFPRELVNVRHGLITGASLWLGFILTTVATGYAYQQRSLALLAIDAGHGLGVLLLQGLVIGLIGP
jgi:hypothetical protein